MRISGPTTLAMAFLVCLTEGELGGMMLHISISCCQDSSQNGLKTGGNLTANSFMIFFFNSLIQGTLKNRHYCKRFYNWVLLQPNTEH